MYEVEDVVKNPSCVLEFNDVGEVTVLGLSRNK